jgi:hypothetical protein
MMGTLATVLAGSKIPTFSDRYRADVEGDIEDVDGVLRITRIRVAYTLSVPPGKADEAREALGTYITRCPAAMSVRGCIDILDSAEITELPAAQTFQEPH